MKEVWDEEEENFFFPAGAPGTIKEAKNPALLPPSSHPPFSPSIRQRKCTNTPQLYGTVQLSPHPFPLSDGSAARRERNRQRKTIPMSVAYSGIKREGEKGFCLPLGWFVSGVRTRCRRTHLRTFEKDISSRRGEMRHWRVLKQQEHHRCFLAFWP